MKGGLAALTVAVLLVGGGDARAQVFAPDDPTGFAVKPGRPPCVATAGDIVVVSQQTDTDVWNARVREAGGAWRRIREVAGCPSVTAAGDGTAAIVFWTGDPEWLLIRRPGETFGAPAPFDDHSVDAVAAAPGGWVALAFRRDQSLRTTVIGPHGATVEHVLDDGRRVQQLAPAAIGVDATGTATAAWTNWDTRRDGVPQRLQAARSAPAGGAWSLLGDPPPGERGLFTYGASLADVAVSASGHVLLSWVTGNGVLASLDGEPPRVVGNARYASPPAVALSDDGSAVIAFAAYGSRVFLAERPAGGGWLPQRLIARGSDGPLEYNEPADDGPREVGLRAVIAPSGAATIAWEAQTLVAVAGRLGGAWSRPVKLSSPFRQLGSWSLDGDRFVWTEATRDDLAPALLHGARVALASPDVTPPVVTARLPSRVRATRTGRFRIRVPVRCDEACDVRLAAGSRDDDLLALSAGRSGTVQVVVLDRVRSGRLRLSLEVADRSGNVTRRSRVVRVR